MHKVFISHHHANDQAYKTSLAKFGDQHNIFVDKSVDTGDISDDLADQTIREKIRDEYLRDSTVTILLVGVETKGRKHIDWEIYSSMIDGRINKKSGILVVNLPSTGCELCTAAHGDEEKRVVHPEVNSDSWTTINYRAEYESRYPHMPDRIIDNLLAPSAKISVVPWEKLNVKRLKFLIDLTFNDRVSCDYDLSRQMKRRNS